jgi:hypothetical protein
LPGDALQEVAGTQAIGFERRSIAEGFVDSTSERQIAGQKG